MKATVAVVALVDFPIMAQDKRNKNFKEFFLSAETVKYRENLRRNEGHSKR